MYRGFHEKGTLSYLGAQGYNLFHKTLPKILFVCKYGIFEIFHTYINSIDIRE